MICSHASIYTTGKQLHFSGIFSRHTVVLSLYQRDPQKYDSCEKHDKINEVRTLTQTGLRSRREDKVLTVRNFKKGISEELVRTAS